MENINELMENLHLLYEDSQLYKGIFWIIDTENYDSALYFQIPCNNEGIIDDEIKNIPLSSKSGTNFNHQKTWNSLDSKYTDNQKYDYYPRGRIEITHGKAIIYCNPNIATEELKKWCIDKFNLTKHNGINKVVLKADGSKHYECYLDREKL